MYARIVDDENGKILVSVDSRKIKNAKNTIETAGKIGEEIAKLAIAKKISKVVFDKRSYKYHGKSKISRPRSEKRRTKILILWLGKNFQVKEKNRNTTKIA